MGNESSKKKSSALSFSLSKTPSSAVIQQHIDNAVKSRVFQLKGSSLKSVPAAIDNDKVVGILRNLDLSQNKIRELPPFISRFSALKQLHLAYNQLATLPDVFGALKALELLDVSYNQLTRLPDALADCVALRNLNVSHNRIVDFPDAILRLPQPDVVDLSNNLIERLPEEINALQAAELNLNSNRLHSLHPNLARCARLKVFRVTENCLQHNEFTPAILADSPIALITYDGNLFQDRQFQDLPGYAAYQERFTATKRKCT